MAPRKFNFSILPADLQGLVISKLAAAEAANLGATSREMRAAVMTRDGRDAAAKLVSKLSEEQQKVLETATMCLSRFVSRDVAEQILVRCV